MKHIYINVYNSFKRKMKYYSDIIDGNKHNTEDDKANSKQSYVNLITNLISHYHSTLEIKYLLKRPEIINSFNIISHVLENKQMNASYQLSLNALTF